MGDVGSAVATPFTAVGSVLSGDADRKIYYKCPSCRKEVWVYKAASSWVGRPCLNCR